MVKKEKLITMHIGDHEAPGLYLTFGDSTQLALTRENVEKITEAYWMDPNKIPPEVKNAIEFQRCDFCPLKEEGDFCDALRPILPLLDIIDKYNSFDEVTAIYKGEDTEVCHVAYTTMQRALRYISNLSLMEYCRSGKRFYKYFNGIIPIAGIEEIVNRLYLNIYWIHKGHEADIDKLISQLRNDMDIATHNQLRRLRLICKNDAFLNAFVLTHMIPDVLYESKDKSLREQLERYEKQRL